MAIFWCVTSIYNSAATDTIYIFFGKSSLLHSLYCIGNATFPICMASSRNDSKSKLSATEIVVVCKWCVFQPYMVSYSLKRRYHLHGDDTFFLTFSFNLIDVNQIE